jgi:choloylglycine hydrolase
MRELDYTLTAFAIISCFALLLATGCIAQSDRIETKSTSDPFGLEAFELCGTSVADLFPSSFPTVGTGSSCSTFMLHTEDAFLIGHNLDSGKEVPGTIVVNNRNVKKTGVSLAELILDIEIINPTIEWTSRYGSITFNAWGKEFIDGGINEEGLYIHEMTLLGTHFPEDDELPRMFMMQWMQYQLDKYATVEEVLSNISTITLDGWTWHFFVSDKDGNSAAIEFIDGILNISTGGSMPIPVLCNGAYQEELDNLGNYSGFGGEEPIRLRDKGIPRFVHAAYMIQDPPQSIDLDYGFKILETLERGLTQWSIVIDIKQGRVYFRTSVGRNIKYIDIASFDFSSDTPVKMLDINSDLKGDVVDYFVDYSPIRNLRAAREGIESTDSYEQGLSNSLARYGYDLDDLVDRVCAVANDGICTSSSTDASIYEDNDDIADDALSKPGPKNKWILPLGVSLAVLLLLSLLLFCLIKRRKSKK